MRYVAAVAAEAPHVQRQAKMDRASNSGEEQEEKKKSETEL